LEVNGGQGLIAYAPAFPGKLTAGCHGLATTLAVTVAGNELADDEQPLAFESQQLLEHTLSPLLVFPVTALP
jgi:hypothetical protein